MRSTLLALAAIAFAAIGGAAQPFNADTISVDSGGRLWRTTPNGQAQTLFKFPFTTHGVMMDVDNRRIIVTHETPSVTYPAGIFAYNPRNATLSTIMSNPGVRPLDVTQNADGDFVFTGNITQGEAGLFRYSPVTNTITTLITTSNIGLPTNLTAGVGIDIRNGRYTIASGSFPASGTLFVWQVDDNGTITTIGPTGSARYSHTQDRRNGNMYVSGYQWIYKTDVNTRLVSTLINGPGDFYAITMDRSSAKTQQMFIRSINRVYTVDVDNQSWTSIAVNLTGSPVYEMSVYGRRNITTASVANRVWRLSLSFPGEAFRPYIIAMSISGLRPGATLPDGRRINLVADALTFLTLNNLLPGVFNPGPGLLDSGGEATAFIDTSRLGTIGVPMHIVASTIANNNLGTISDPIVLPLP